MEFLRRLFRRLRPSRRPPTLVSGGSGFVVIDVETTGLAPGEDRVLEIAAVRTDRAGRIVEEWTTLVNPDGPVGATEIHGIAESDVRPAPRFADLAGELAARLAGHVVVAHNARFDLAFLRAEFDRSGWPMPDVATLCTLEASLVYLPHLERRKLAACCAATGIELRDAHSALADARATAQLLGYYLDPRAGVPPRPEHLRLPDVAATIAWPDIPRQPVVPTLRRRPVEVAAPGTLWTLLTEVPLSTVVEEGAPEVAMPYLELLYQVLEDGVLTHAGARSLAGLAHAYALSYDQIQVTHRAFLLALTHRIVAAGAVTAEEWAVLHNAAAALRITDDLPRRMVDEARAALQSQRGQVGRPLPPQWPHGVPLRVGQGVAFTEGDPIQRARLEARAQAVGLRVTGSVSPHTAVLVADRVEPTTVKARTARQYGVRVVSPPVFAVLLDYVQPADESDASRDAIVAEKATEVAVGDGRAG